MKGAPAVPAAQPAVRPVAHHQLDKAQVAGDAELLHRRLAGGEVVLVDVDAVGVGPQEFFQVAVAAGRYGGVKAGLQRRVIAADVSGGGHGATVVRRRRF